MSECLIEWVSKHPLCFYFLEEIVPKLFANTELFTVFFYYLLMSCTYFSFLFFFFYLLWLWLNTLYDFIFFSLSILVSLLKFYCFPRVCNIHLQLTYDHMLVPLCSASTIKQCNFKSSPCPCPLNITLIHFTYPYVTVNQYIITIILNKYLLEKLRIRKIKGSSLCLLCLPALTGGFFTSRTTWEAPIVYT